MKLVHFYKNNKKVYSAYYTDIDDVKSNPLNYYDKFDKNCIISEEDFENPITLNGIVRDSTKQELLESGKEINLSDGEYIKDGKIATVPRPSEYHIWDKDIWKLDKEMMINSKRNLLKMRRDEEVSSDFKIKIKARKDSEEVEYTFKARPSDISYMEQFKSTLDMINQLGIDKNTKNKESVLKQYGIDSKQVKEIVTFIDKGTKKWILADNTEEEFDFDVLKIILVLIQKRNYDTFEKFGRLYEKVLELGDDFKSIQGVDW